MAINRNIILDENFTSFLTNATAQAPTQTLTNVIHSATTLDGYTACDLFETQIISRHLDLIARKLKAENKCFYTIASTGNEGTAAVAKALAIKDMGFLHYRSGAFMIQRAKAVPDESQIFNVLLSLGASSHDPTSGGRHKVFGSLRLNIPPQTSTIASHLHKAVGTAFAIERATHLELATPLQNDSIVFASFGDASFNHSSAQGAINAAQWASYQNIPMPIMFICEDNNIGISVRTPDNWIQDKIQGQTALEYFQADGLDLCNCYDVAKVAVEHCRDYRVPVFLHVKTIRLLGHAGSDIELQYRKLEKIEAVEAQDPLIRSATMLIDTGLMSPADIIELYESTRQRIEAIAKETVTRPTLTSVAEVIEPLAPYSADAVNAEATRNDFEKLRIEHYRSADKLPENSKRPRHLAIILNQGLNDILLKYPESFIFGQDVAKKGGVYHVTHGLAEAAGPARVFNTLLDEQTILGIAQGMGHMDMLPIAEIQYLAYFHNAEDQIRGEAASLLYFSNGQFKNPMILRMASYAYQKGFGGHFHNDNSIAVLRDIPGIIIASPTTGADAVKMLRTCMALGKVDGRVIIFLEPIALYMTKDLHAADDDLWQTRYPALDTAIPLGEGSAHNEGHGNDMTIISYGNGYYLSRKAARILMNQHKIQARVVDLRWLAPLNHDFIREQADATGKVLIVDECRKTGSLSESIASSLHEHDPNIKLRRHCAEDCYIPLGDAANLLLPSIDSIVKEALTIAC